MLNKNLYSEFLTVLLLITLKSETALEIELVERDNDILSRLSENKKLLEKMRYFDKFSFSLSV